MIHLQSEHEKMKRKFWKLGEGMDGPRVSEIPGLKFSELDEQAILSEFTFNWVLHTLGLELNQTKLSLVINYMIIVLRIKCCVIL